MNGLITIGTLAGCKEIGAHSHTIWEMVYYPKGDVRLTVEETEYYPQAGTFVCLPPGASHKEQGMEFYDNIYFSVEQYTVLPKKLLMVQDTQSHAILNQLMALQECFLTKGFNYKATEEAILNTITQYVVGLLHVVKPENPYVEQAKLMLAEGASDNGFRLEKLYQNTPYSADHFRLCFKKETGVTPAQYLKALRIEKAKKLLNMQYFQEDVHIKTIANMCGFDDQLYFSRVFKRYTGFSPSDYRKGKGALQ